MNPQMGGVVQAVHSIINSLNSYHVESEILSLDCKDESFINSQDVVVHAMGPAKGPWQYSKLLRPWLNLNLEQFDAVILHGIWLYQDFALSAVIKKIGRPGRQPVRFYIMPHGMLDPYFQQEKSRKIKAVRNWLYFKLIQGRIIKSADALLFTCEKELQLARKSFKGYMPKQEINVGFGIEAPPPFDKQMLEDFFTVWPSGRSKPYLLFLSRLHQKKGVDMLLHAYSKMLDGCTSSEIPDLVIAGPGMDTTYGRNLWQLFNDLKGLKNKVHFTGMLSGNTKWGAYYGCQAFILPSHQENFGIAVVEAMTCSKPVLISDQINISLEIEQAGAGIVNANTVAGTLETLESWINLPRSGKNDMRLKARKAFEDNFAIEKAATRFLQAIKTTP